jgi:hypothetical protein
MGLGKPDKKCTCIHYRQPFSGIKMNLIYEKDPNCPIHGK